MQVDLRVPVGLPVLQTADFIARCEDAGFDGVGVHDHPHSARDVYAVLAIAAERTRIVRLYPATSSPIVRHPLLLASAAHSLEEIAPGRIRLTIAPGFLAARSIGQPRATVAVMREAVTTVRRLLAGDPVPLGASETRLRNRSAVPTPVYLLAAGPRMVELAGEVADGALLLVGLHPAAIAEARRRIEAGAERAGRSLNGFRTIFIVPIALEDTRAHAERWIRDWFAPGQPFVAYPSASNLHWLRHAGIDIADDVTPSDIAADQATRIADAFGLVGPPEHCVERLQRARDEAGVDHVFLFPAHTLAGGYEMPTREVEAFRRIIRARV
jgi:5,10-methylenetetrahydromethanopterin reductase